MIEIPAGSFEGSPEISIYDPSGRLVSKPEVIIKSSKKLQINLTDLKSGLYFVGLKQLNKKPEIIRIFKK